MVFNVNADPCEILCFEGALCINSLILYIKIDFLLVSAMLQNTMYIILKI